VDLARLRLNSRRRDNDTHEKDNGQGRVTQHHAATRGLSTAAIFHPPSIPRNQICPVSTGSPAPDRTPHCAA
jgi:hypothetical protein